MSFFSQFIFDSLTIVSIYLLVALGLTLIFGVMKIPNFAHGGFYALGGYLGYTVGSQLGGGYVIGLIAAVVSLFVIGTFIERGLIRPVLKQHLAPLIVALGLLFAIGNVILNVWGSWPLYLPSPLTELTSVFGATFQLHRILMMLGGFGGAVLLYLFLMKTNIGRAIRAVSQDVEAAASVGVNVSRIRTISFGISCSLAALAGVLVGPFLHLSPTMGELMTIKAFAIVVLGGLGNVQGAVISSFILGFGENFVNTYVLSGYGMIISFVVIIITLLLKPRGLFG